MSCETRKHNLRGSGRCAPARGLGRRPSLQTIVRAYIARHRADACDELRGFRNEPSLKAAIERAGMARRLNGKRYNHQRRLPEAVLQAGTAALHRASLSAANDFHDLHGRVKKALSSIWGIGELTIYDTSLRIGAKLGLFPDAVYLHSGTRQGARALGLNWRAEHVDVQDCPREFRVLAAHEIEDCLCIYKDQLAV